MLRTSFTGETGHLACSVLIVAVYSHFTPKLFIGKKCEWNFSVSDSIILVVQASFRLENIII